MVELAGIEPASYGCTSALPQSTSMSQPHVKKPRNVLPTRLGAMNPIHLFGFKKHEHTNTVIGICVRVPFQNILFQIIRFGV